MTPYLRITGSASADLRQTVSDALVEAGLVQTTTVPTPHHTDPLASLILCVDSDDAVSLQPPEVAYHLRFVFTETSTLDEVKAVVASFVANNGTRRFTSTRGPSEDAVFLSVVRDGLAADGGLYMLKKIPVMPTSQLRFLCKSKSLNYVDAARMILEQLVDVSIRPAQLFPLVLQAYDPSRWSEKENICPLTAILEGEHAVLRSPSRSEYKKENVEAVSDAEASLRGVQILELYHGPTAAFKDFALQLFPRYFHLSTLVGTPKTAPDAMSIPTVPQYVILAATSGDTGVAAISGFVNAGGHSKVMILYPMHGVSPVQQLQMLSYDNGTSVRVYGLPSDFDFCQTTVKTIFSDGALKQKLETVNPEQPMRISSANSINWGRLIPQVAYYFWAYRQQAQRAEIEHDESWHLGDAMDVVVPCGNFGNILAAYVAKLMQLPIRHLIVASNKNDVLYEFIQTGVYDIRERHLSQTASPSIDILKASNVERFLFLLSDGDTAFVKACMESLDRDGHFELPDAMKARMQETFIAGRCTEEECGQTISEIFKASSHRRLLDPHTAVAVFVARQYRDTQLLERSMEPDVARRGAALPPLVVASTAHWAKFPEPVLHAIKDELPTVGEPAATPAEAVHNVRALFGEIGELAGAHGDVSVQPALAAMLDVAEDKAKAPRAVAADRDKIVDELVSLASENK